MSLNSGISKFLLIVAFTIGSPLIVIHFMKFKTRTNYLTNTESNDVTENYIRRLNATPSVEDIFMYMNNPPAACYQVIKLGGFVLKQPNYEFVHFDGDKMICENPSPKIPYGNCLIYSFGSNYDFSFEKDVWKRYKCEIFTFDPSLNIKKLKMKNYDYIKFYKIGIAPEDSSQNNAKWTLKSLKTLKKMLGHSNRKINILKIDIEGAEWNILSSLIGTKELEQVDHLNVEFHIANMAQPINIYPKLERMGFRLFSSRVNLFNKPQFIKELGTHEHMLSELAFYKPS